MGSFRRYDSFNDFIIQPINYIIEQQGDINSLREQLKIHSNNVKGEILANCRAHRSIEDRVVYRRKIYSKLKGLHRTFFIRNSNDSNEDISIKSNKLKKIFRLDVVNVLDDLKHFVTQIGDIPQKINFMDGKQQKESSFKLIKAIRKEDIIDVCHELKKIPKLTIDLNTDEELFYQCFSGEQVITKVKWLRNNVLHYFIKELASAQLIEYPPSKIWETAVLCFVDKNGHDYTAKQIGKIHHFKNDRLKEKINDIIEPLKNKNTGVKKHGSTFQS